jgi:hypothetical protein
MEPKYSMLFSCVLYKRKLNLNTLRFYIILRNRDLEFKVQNVSKKITEDERKLFCIFNNWTAVTSILC